MAPALHPTPDMRPVATVVIWAAAFLALVAGAAAQRIPLDYQSVSGTPNTRTAAASLTLFGGAAAAPARAAWSVSSSEDEKATAGGIEHRRVLFAEKSGGNQATLELALFSTKSATVRVIDNPDGAFVQVWLLRYWPLAAWPLYCPLMVT